MYDQMCMDACMKLKLETNQRCKMVLEMLELELELEIKVFKYACESVLERE